MVEGAQFRGAAVPRRIDLPGQFRRFIPHLAAMGRATEQQEVHLPEQVLHAFAFKDTATQLRQFAQITQAIPGQPGTGQVLQSSPGRGGLCGEGHDAQGSAPLLFALERLSAGLLAKTVGLNIPAGDRKQVLAQPLEVILQGLAIIPRFHMHHPADFVAFGVDRTHKTQHPAGIPSLRVRP